MWTTITHQDIQRVRGELTHSHFQMDLRHAEELEALITRHKQERSELDAGLAKIEELQRGVEAFVREFLPVADAEKHELNPSPAPVEVEVVATWANVKFGFGGSLGSR